MKATYDPPLSDVERILAHLIAHVDGLGHATACDRIGDACPHVLAAHTWLRWRQGLITSCRFNHHPDQHTNECVEKAVPA